MHGIANSPQPPDLSTSNEGTNQISAELISSLFLSRTTPSTHPSLDSFSSPRSIGKKGGGFDVSQLPVEIVCEIFEKFVEDDTPHPIPNRDDTPRPLVSRTCRADPTELGQICSRWRTVAINLPKLWSNILIYNPKSSQIHLTDLWLERSRKGSLNLEINYDAGNRNYDIEAAAHLLRSFIAHLGRWKQFRFNLSIKLLGLLYALVDSPHKPPILESIDLGFPDVFRYNDTEVHINAIDAIWKYFHGCPSLRQVVWHGREVNSFPKHAPFQLTRVHAWFCVSIDDILSFLPHIPLIEELQLEALRLPSKNTPGIVSPPLLVQHLRLLRIRSHEIPATSFVASLTCPSLDSLIIIHSNLSDQSNQNLQELPRFLRRSGSHLQKLDLRDSGINIPNGEWNRCLSNSPLQLLLDLHLSTGCITDQIVGLLSRKSPAGLHEFAPVLETLDLPSCETSDGLLAGMVSSRWYEALNVNHSTPVGRLRRAVIFPRKHFGPIDEAFFSSNVLY